MRQLIDQQRATFSSFLEQRRDLLLVVHASDADSVFVLQLASEIDQASGEDLFVISSGDFIDPDSYASSCAEAFARQYVLAAEAVVAAGKPPLPPLPPGLLAPGRPGHLRLQDMVAFAHELLPPEARRLVVVIAPTSIAQRMPFLGLVAALLPRPERERWMSRLRLIVRDVAGPELKGEREHPLVAKTPAHLATTHLDLGPEKVRESLAASAQDESVPPAARMQSLLASAILDGVYGEWTVALEKLLRVLAYHQGEKNLLMQALTANAVGEVCEGGGALERAQHWFECALGLAVESESALALIIAAQNLGKLCFRRGDFASAVQYFDGVTQVAPKLLDNETKSWALEQRGASEAALGQNAQAIQTWAEGANLCRNTDHTSGLRAHLTRLRDAYASAGSMDEQRRAELELASLGRELSHA